MSTLQYLKTPVEFLQDRNRSEVNRGHATAEGKCPAQSFIEAFLDLEPALRLLYH